MAAGPRGDEAPDAKQRWRAAVGPAALSASDFGKALGLLGRVYDFWHAEVVVLPAHPHLRFAGNEHTRHGQRQEPVARAFYSLLFETDVLPGGFWVHPDHPTLAASPDGLVPNHPEDQGDGGEQLGSVSPLLQFRLLEVKCPAYCLYDPARPAHQPHGLPQTYLCQVQGQLAVVGAACCDVFVYCAATQQVVCKRVWRCPEFWAWAAPKLQAVGQWLRDGAVPPEVTRAFGWEPFQYSAMQVDDLLGPSDITALLLARGHDARTVAADVLASGGDAFRFYSALHGSGGPLPTCPGPEPHNSGPADDPTPPPAAAGPGPVCPVPATAPHTPSGAVAAAWTAVVGRLARWLAWLVPDHSAGSEAEDPPTKRRRLL